jgi:hypothetical protein
MKGKRRAAVALVIALLSLPIAMTRRVQKVRADPTVLLSGLIMALSMQEKSANQTGTRKGGT